MKRVRSHPSFRKAPRAGFTLVELLIVIAIIGLLAAILFPAFRRAQEGAAQASCASNLKQIYQAVELYRQDEKYYPSSLAFLLPADFTLGGTTTSNTDGTGYYKGGRDDLTCKDDDTDASTVRSSYGDISSDPLPAPASGSADMSRYLWNYWGYRATSGTNCTSSNASECAGTAYQSPTEALATVGATGFDLNLLLDPAVASKPTTAATLKRNPFKYSMSNRFAPTSIILTHCIYHRLPTANGKMSGAYELTDPALTQNTALARDIVLRRDGSARVLDVSNFHNNNNWAKQNW